MKIPAMPALVCRQVEAGVKFLPAGWHGDTPLLRHGTQCEPTRFPVLCYGALHLVPSLLAFINKCFGALPLKTIFGFKCYHL